MIKKGDLVFFNTRTRDQDRFSGNAIVLTQPYATIFTDRDSSGKAMYTSEKLVVDVLDGNKFLSKIPLDSLHKVE